jgi:hypothetical protein
MFTSTVAPTTGEAFIAVKKNRVRSYPTNLANINNSVYLSDKQEFEIELNNPSTSTKLAKISINGKQISSSGIVLKPGQRAYIERYIDTPRKFQFETYVVDNNPSVTAAIQQNGLIKVSFYDEHVPPAPVYFDWNSMVGSSAQNVNYLNQRDSNIRSMDFMHDGAATMSMFSSRVGDNAAFDRVKKSIPTQKETGRIEQGDVSNQTFTNYSGSFNSWSTNTVKIKLLPFSEKPLEVNEISQYCTECGTKNKSGKYKFCPTCGNKF